MTPARQPHKGMEHCSDASVVFKGDGVAWIKCDTIVGDCFWIVKNGKCPKQHTSPQAPSCQTCVDEMAIFCQGCPNLIAHLNGEIKKNVAEHDTQVAKSAREQVLDEMIKLSMMIETNETERWETRGRPKNDGYINGSHSGYGHALRDMRQWIDRIKKAESLQAQQEQP